MRRFAPALYLTAVLVLAAMLIPLPTATAGEEGRGGLIWSHHFVGEGQVVVVDASGAYVGARHSGDVSIIKYDATGQQLWTRGLGNIALQLRLAMNASTLYVVGRTQGSSTLDLVLQALSTNGLPLWNRQFETELTDESPVDVAADTSGVYVVGHTTDRSTNYPTMRASFVHRYDKDGHEIWSVRFGTPEDSLSGVALDASGVYVVGRVAYRVALWKFDLDGRYAWNRQFNTGGGMEALSIAADSSGIYVVGTTSRALPNQMPIGGDDAFIRKYTSNGDELWTRQFGAPGFPGTPAVDMANAVAVTEYGVYVGGTVRVGSTGASTDAFIRKFNASGADLWGLINRGSAAANDIAVGDTGIYLTGETDQLAGGNLVRFGETPSPPRDLQATPGEAQVRLEWTSPRFDGGMPVKGYRIYRGTAPMSLEPTSFERATALTYLDTDVMNQVTYYYAVSAVNEIGEGPRAPAVAATPGTPPVVANPGPPPPDFILFGALAVLGAALILTVYRLRGSRNPRRGPVEGGCA